MEIVKQLAVFLENKPGALLRLAQDLAAKQINLLAISVTDSVDHAVVRLVVDKPTDAIHLLGETGVLVVESDLLRVKVSDSPGVLAEFCAKLSTMNVNIEYAYGSSTPETGNAYLYIRVLDPHKTLADLTS